MAIRLTESRLRQIIREEASRLREGIWPPGPRQMPKPRKLLTYSWIMACGENELPQIKSLAAESGCNVVTAEPTGEMREAFDEDGYETGETPEMQLEVHGTLPQLRKFYYATSELMDGSAQSIESFDARDLGIMPVR